MDLVYFGSGAFGLPTLGSLAQRHAIRAIVTQPDKPAGRGAELTPTPIAAWAAQHLTAVPIIKPPRINDTDTVRRIRETAADAWVIVAFGQKLGSPLLEGRFACNLHASLLPRWRGAAPINAAILAGDLETGNSVITIADRMDAGDILGQSRRKVTPELTAGELHDLLAQDGPSLVLSVLNQFSSGTVQAIRQDESAATAAHKLSKSDAWVDFSLPADACRNRIHGLTPWPGVTARLGSLELKLCRAQTGVPVSQSHPQGTIIDAPSGLIACGQGTTLRLLEVQPPGKRRMPWPDFARGHRLTPGDLLSSTPPTPPAPR